MVKAKNVQRVVIANRRDWKPFHPFEVRRRRDIQNLFSFLQRTLGTSDVDMLSHRLFYFIRTCGMGRKRFTRFELIIHSPARGPLRGASCGIDGLARVLIKHFPASTLLEMADAVLDVRKPW